MDRKRIEQIFDSMPEVRLSGNNPYVCSGVQLFYVQAGDADLFYRREGGGLFPLCSYHTGDVFCASDMLQVGGREGGVLRCLPLAQLALPDSYLPDFTTEFLHCADRLVRALCPEMPDGVSYDGAGAALGPGGVLRCSGNPSFITVEGEGEYCGALKFDGRVVLPFTRGGWLKSSQFLDILASELTLQTVHEGLEAFAGFVTVAAQAACRAEKQDWQDLSLKRAENDQQIFRQALQSMAGVMENPVGSMDSPDELTKVCAFAAEASGISLENQPPVVVKSVEDFALRYHCRVRAVTLRGDWYRHDAGVVVAYYQQKPVALVPSGDKYTMHYADGSSCRVTPEIAAAVHSECWSFFLSLPQVLPKRADILRIAFQGSRGDLLFVLLLGLMTGLLGMVSPYLTGSIVNTVIPSGSHEMMLQLSLGLMVAAVAGSFFGLTQNYCLLRFSSRSTFQVEASIWDRLLNLPASFFGRYDAGDLANRANGISAVREILSQQLLSTALAFVVGMFNMIVAFLYSWQLSLVVLVFSVTGSLAGLGLSFVQLRYQRRVQEASGKLQGMVLQFITAISKIRVCGAESRAFARWSNLFRTQKRYGFEYSIFAQISSMIFAILPFIQTAITFYIVTSMDDEHRLSTGSYMAFSAAAAQFSGALSSIAGLVTALVEALPHYERAKPLLEQEVEQVQSGSPIARIKGYVEVRGVDFSYENGPKVLDDVSLSAAAGEFIAIVGPSGSGKSTLLKILLGLQKPQAGAVLVDNTELASINLKGLRKQFGVVLQEGGMMQGSIYSNICGAKRLSLDEAWDALRMAGLEQEVGEMPMGIHTVMPQGGGVLSGGQQQRLYIARALAGSPRVLFFDEATSALDNRIQAEVAGNISRLNLTRIVVAHRLSTIRDADRIYVMENGRVVQCGDYSQLLEQKDGLFYSLCMRQML